MPDSGWKLIRFHPESDILFNVSGCIEISQQPLSDTIQLLTIA